MRYRVSLIESVFGRHLRSNPVRDGLDRPQSLISKTIKILGNILQCSVDFIQSHGTPSLWILRTDWMNTWVAREEQLKQYERGFGQVDVGI